MFLSVIPLSGCAVTGLPGDALDAEFRLRGKIGVRSESKTERAFSASFNWVQANERYVIELWGPFGQGRTRIDGDGQTVTITDARGVALAGDAPETLMHEQLGWSAPVHVLRYWVRGQPAPRYPARSRDHDVEGNLVRFEQVGWTVQLTRWRDSASGPLPGRITATRQGRRITIICKEWLSG